MDISKFQILKVRDGWIVKRTRGTYKQHAHFRDKKGCKKLLNFIKENKIPYDSYYKNCCKRILTQKEYKELRQSKTRYYNKGRRRYDIW